MSRLNPANMQHLNLKFEFNKKNGFTQTIKKGLTRQATSTLSRGGPAKRAPRQAEEGVCAGGELLCNVLL